MGCFQTTFQLCFSIISRFSTFFVNSRYYQRAISDGSTVIEGANNRPVVLPEA